MSDTLALISSRYRLRRAYVANLLAARGVKASATARAEALGLSRATTWRLFHEPVGDESGYFAGPDAVKTVCALFPEEPFLSLWEPQ